MIINQIVNLEQVALDKYGRLLADVYFENKHIKNPPKGQPSSP